MIFTADTFFRGIFALKRRYQRFIKAFLPEESVAWRVQQSIINDYSRLRDTVAVLQGFQQSNGKWNCRSKTELKLLGVLYGILTQRCNTCPKKCFYASERYERLKFTCFLQFGAVAGTVQHFASQAFLHSLCCFRLSPVRPKKPSTQLVAPDHISGRPENAFS